MAGEPLAPEPVLFSQDPEGDFHVAQWLELVRRRRWLIIASTAVCVAGAVVQYAISPKMYQAKAVIQIERRSTTATSVQKFINIEDWYDAQNFFPTQYRLLQSRGLAERVVRNLRLAEDPQFNPGRAQLIGRAAKAPATAADDEATLAGLAYGILGGLSIDPVRNTRLVEISYNSPYPALAARIANGVAEAYIDWGIETRTANVGRASSFLTSQIETIKQEIQDKEAQLQAYSRRTDIVALDPGSNVTLARLEALNKDYIETVSERIAKEARYKELMASPNELVADTMSGSQIQQDRADLLKLERDYSTKLNVYKPDWPAMVELKSQIDRSRQHLDKVIGEVVSKVRETARAEYLGVQRREEALTGELTRQKAEAMKLNSAAVEYNNLKVEVSTRRALLDELVRRQSETEVESRVEGSRESNVLFVDRALTPGSPYRPSLRRSLLLGFAVGLTLGLGAVFLIEYLDRTIKTPEDVDRILNLPILGVIPNVAAGRTARYGAYRSYGYGYGYRYGYGHRSSRSRSAGAETTGQTESATPGEQRPEDDEGKVIVELLPHHRPRVPACEAYRALRTALLLSHAGGIKSVVITSAVPGEGKSATATNLAVVLSQLDREVLVVDADLRKPRLHQVFGISNRVGLVNQLTGDPDLAAAFVRTDIPKLYVTPSGPIPPNPSELLASERMRDFILLARQRFDYVIFDSPPAMVVTDATVLGALNDGVVLTVGAGIVLREDAIACSRRLVQSGVKILGVALNRFQLSHGRYGKRYSQYRYHGYTDYYGHQDPGEGKGTA